MTEHIDVQENLRVKPVGGLVHSQQVWVNTGGWGGARERGEGVSSAWGAGQHGPLSSVVSEDMAQEVERFSSLQFPSRLSPLR